MTINKIKLSITIKHNYNQHNDIQKNNIRIATLSIMTLYRFCYDECYFCSVIYDECCKQALYAECHYAECHYYEFHYNECHCVECGYAMYHGNTSFSQLASSLTNNVLDHTSNLDLGYC